MCGVESRLLHFRAVEQVEPFLDERSPRLVQRVYGASGAGKTAEEMLALLQERLPRSTDDEIATAGDEQRKITALRLRKL